MSITFILFIIVIFVGGLLLGAALLYGLNRLYKIYGNTFGRSLLIVLLTFVIEGVFTVLSLLLPDLAGPVNLLGFFAPWVAGYYLYRRFFQTSLKQFLIVFVTYYLAGLLLVILSLFVRAQLFEPIFLTGDSMAPTYQSGDYIFFEKWDKSINKGDIVLVSISCTNGQAGCLGIMRVSAIPGDTVNGTRVQSDEYYLASDNRPGKSGKVTIDAIIGKSLLNVGQTGI